MFGRKTGRTRVMGGGCLCGAHRARAAAATTRFLHTYACEGADENSWPSRQRTGVPTMKPCCLPRGQCVSRCVCASNQVGLRARSATSQAKLCFCKNNKRRVIIVAKTRSRQTFRAITIASSSIMTQPRSAAVVLGGQGCLNAWQSERVSWEGVWFQWERCSCLSLE